jgi:hypothetical protein
VLSDVAQAIAIAHAKHDVALTWLGRTLIVQKVRPQSGADLSLLQI